MSQGVAQRYPIKSIAGPNEQILNPDAPLNFKRRNKMERQFFVNFQENGIDKTEVIIARSGNEALRKFFTKIGNRRIVNIITVVDGANGELAYANG